MYAVEKLEEIKQSQDTVFWLVSNVETKSYVRYKQNHARSVLMLESLNSSRNRVLMFHMIRHMQTITSFR